MLYQRGRVNHKLGSFGDALDDLNMDLRIDEGHREALSLRARVHYAMRDCEDCIIDCGELLKLKSDENIEKLIDKARSKLKKLRNPSSKRQLSELRSRESFQQAV